MKKSFEMTFLFVFIDQLVKIIIMTVLDIYESVSIIKGFFSITYVQNTGAAFSILRGNQFFLIIMALLSLIAIYYFFIRKKSLTKGETFIYSLLMGGIIGNLIDRVVYNSVIDYLDFNFFGYNFPIFNLADTFIVVSVALIVIFTMREDRNE